MNWKDEILKTHKGKTGFFKELENKQKHRIMKNEQLEKSLKNAQNMLNVIIDQTLRGNDHDLLVWKELNKAIESIENARAILHNNK